MTDRDADSNEEPANASDEREQEESEETAESEETEEDGEEARPQITLDRYLSQRRPPPRAGLSYIVAAILMLITLVLIVIYKDRCGQVISGMVGEMDPPSTSGTPARIELKRPEKKQE